MPAPVTAQALNQLSSTIIGSAIQIHRAFGPGLLENAYLACLCHELKAVRLRLEVQKGLPLIYNGVRIDCAFRPDIIVEDVVVVEIKALDTIAPVHSRQLRTYTKLANCRLGLLLNFGAPTIKEGIIRVVNDFPEQ
jgi:GxxExxY protein